ncbi:phosphoenolpyruvate--protein phosphotransferase [Mesorhizobium sp. IMUNJ 23232]|uniref:phosphoenolpyruvate--protein phosphotransferase n=1 Tax=Mesorhizobium sp. IMUNJ 23232 TaxID=3376064 RepID=UPI0037AC1559
MSGPHRLTGIPASHGYAKGPVFDLDTGSQAHVSTGHPEEEARALTLAIESASEQLAALAAKTVGEAADMLEFQLAMLADESLSAPAFALIDQGASADGAWSYALDEQIDSYEASEDEYFRARSADLKDIRQQVLEALAPAGSLAVPSGAILVGDDIAPTRFLAVDWSQGGGIALAKGSSASHVAMLARARGVPMVVGLGPVPSNFDLPVFLDAEHGHVLLGPGGEAEELFHRAAEAFAVRRRAAEENSANPAATADGTPVRVLINVADPSDVERIDIATCDGVGLMRTEFLFGKAGGLPDEETQYRAYRKVLEWAAGKPVTIRTVDAGGDKPVPGYTVEEGNPFLGLRGIRLSLARPEIFRVQIRALLRSAVHGNLKIMFPMVAVPEEFAIAAALFAEEAETLANAGGEYAIPPLGIMVEVPSTAIAPELFADVAFFSIGSNDLTQYVMAAARDNTAVAALNSVHNPAVLRLIASVAAFGQANGIPVSLCGDAGGDPAAIPALLEAGLRDLSVVPAQLALAKAAIAGVTL